MNSNVNCDEIRERMPDIAAGLTAATAEESQHLASCEACAGKLAEFRQTMALLDEWQAPEPSSYFDTRLQARLREEMAKPQAGWLHWLRRPVLAGALTLALGVSVGLFFARNGGIYQQPGPDISDNEPGTAVSDLQALDKNQDVYSDFDLLDDLTVQKDVDANP
jgi:hypothetical protein